MDCFFELDSQSSSLIYIRSVSWIKKSYCV